MRHPRSIPTLCLLSALLGCGTSPVGDNGRPINPMGLEAVVAGEPAPVLHLGDPVPVVLHTHSGAAVTVGALDCVADLEILDPKGGRWHRLSSLKICIEIAVRVANGADHPFTVPAPGVTGRYRVVFEALLATGGSFTVHSNAFDVTEPPPSAP